MNYTGIHYTCSKTSVKIMGVWGGGGGRPIWAGKKGGGG
jgi:hypothetical protein